MNEQDLLAQLRDIHVPEPAGWWPPAPGWWLLAALLLALAVAAIWLAYQYRAKNAYRRIACAELDSAWEQLQDSGDRDAYVLALGQILRRTALAAYPGESIGSLHGESWLAFLDDTSPESRAFSEGPGRDLLILPYRPVTPEQDLKPLHDLVRQWLAEHRALRANKPREMQRVAV